MAAKKPQDKAEGAAAAAPPAAGLPAAIRLLQPHGFIDDAGKNHYWQQMQVVFEPADIALLIGRGVSFEVCEPE